LETSASLAQDELCRSEVLSVQVPCPKDLESYDFSAVASLSKKKGAGVATVSVDLVAGQYLPVGPAWDQQAQLAVALGPAACREGLKGKFFTAVVLVN